MKVYRLDLPATVKLGTREHNRALEQNTVFFVGGADDAAIIDIASRKIGEFMAQMTIHLGNEPISDVMKNVIANDQRTQPQEDIEKLLRDAQADLGSITLTGVFVESNQFSDDLVEFRLEAREGDRRRVIKVGDKKSKWATFTPDQLVEAVERKF